MFEVTRILAQIESGDPPQWLCDIIAKLHAKNPDERYQSAREVADVLAKCESQLIAQSEQKDFLVIPQTKAQAVRWWKWVGVAMLSLLLVVVGLIAFNRSATQLSIGRDVTNKLPMPDSDKGESSEANC